MAGGGIAAVRGGRRERGLVGASAPPQPRTTAADLVEESLRADILAIRLRPGAPLVEKELTQRFGVSRTPVREALLRLKDAGLVEVFPQSGTFVARIPVAAIPEAAMIRQALECAMAERAAGTGSSEAIRRLDLMIVAQAEAADAGDMAAFHEADEAFHEELAHSAGFPGVWKVAHAAKIQIDRCRLLTLPVPGRMEHVMREHLAILEAVRRGDAQLAHEAMATHLGALLPDLPVLRQAHPDYFI